jgi:desumoylating isopeptidase 1
MLTNALALNAVANDLTREGTYTRAVDVLVLGLLHTDTAVRTAAASVAFNLIAGIQRARIDRVRSGRNEVSRDDADGEWEVEVMSAMVEAIQREDSNEDIGSYLSFRSNLSSSF